MGTYTPTAKRDNYRWQYAEWYTGPCHGGHMWHSKEGTMRADTSQNPLFDVPNAVAHSFIIIIIRFICLDSTSQETLK